MSLDPRQSFQADSSSGAGKRVSIMSEKDIQLMSQLKAKNQDFKTSQLERSQLLSREKETQKKIRRVSIQEQNTYQIGVQQTALLQPIVYNQKAYQDQIVPKIDKIYKDYWKKHQGRKFASPVQIRAYSSNKAIQMLLRKEPIKIIF